MRTTIAISPTLLESVRRLAARRRTTLRALVEEGLRLVLERSPPAAPFRLRDCSFKGEGPRSGASAGLGAEAGDHARTRYG